MCYSIHVVGEQSTEQSFHHVGPGDQTQVVRLGHKPLFSSHPILPTVSIFFQSHLYLDCQSQNKMSGWYEKRLGTDIKYSLKIFIF